MHMQTQSVQALNRPAPQNAKRDSVARTMSSREIAELVEARHNDVVASIERLFAKNLLRSSRKSRREATGGRPVDVYDLIERDTHLVVAGYSDEHRAKVIDRWQELEGHVAVALPDFTNPASLPIADCTWPAMTWCAAWPACRWRSVVCTIAPSRPRFSMKVPWLSQAVYRQSCQA